MKAGFSLVFLLLGLSAQVALGARDEEAWKKERQLDSAYKTFTENLREYNGYLFFYEKQLKEFYQTVKDSVKVQKAALAQRDEEIVTLDARIVKLEKELKEVQTNLAESEKREATIDALGGSWQKGSFATTMTTLLIIFLAGAGFVYFLFARSNKLTSTYAKDLDTVRDEMETLRKRSVDREMKLNRELQTERNKLEELKSLRR